MGCGGSKKGHKKEKCDMTMENTGNSDIDSIFQTFSAPLQTLAEITNELKKGENKLRRRTHAYLITGCTLEDSIRAFLIGLSASTNGDFDKVELKVTDESPYILVNKHKVEKFLEESVEAWNYLVEKLIKAATKLPDLVPQIKDMVEECKNIPDRAKSVIDGAGLGIIEVAKIMKVVSGNVSKIAKAPAMIEELKKSIEQITHVCKNLPKLLDHEGREKIHHIGKEVHKANVKDMEIVIINHWPDKVKVDIKLKRPRKVKQGHEAHGGH